MPVHLSRTLVGYLRGRTRFFDGVVAEAARQGTGTIVVVGAGYDDRSWRFRTPGIRFVEVDHPTTQRDKKERLDRLGIDTTHVCFVPADLERDALDDVLAAAGALDPTLPTTFICEGLLPYLSPPCVDATLAALGRCDGPNEFAADFPVRPANVEGRLALSVLRAFTSVVGEPVRTILDGDQELTALLHRCGWKERNRATAHDIGRMPRAVRPFSAGFVVAEPEDDARRRHRTASTPSPG